MKEYKSVSSDDNLVYMYAVEQNDKVDIGFFDDNPEENLPRLRCMAVAYRPDVGDKEWVVSNMRGQIEKQLEWEKENNNGRQAGWRQNTVGEVRREDDPSVGMVRYRWYTQIKRRIVRTLRYLANQIEYGYVRPPKGTE